MEIQDTISREMILKASRDKVWDAITRPDMLTQWFAHKMNVSTLVIGQEFVFDWRPDYGYSRAVVVQLDPKSHFAYRWENGMDDHDTPFTECPTTLVTFELEEVEGGTRLTVTETGIRTMRNPARVYEENSRGWETELGELKAYVEAA